MTLQRWQVGLVVERTNHVTGESSLISLTPERRQQARAYLNYELQLIRDHLIMIEAGENSELEARLSLLHKITDATYNDEADCVNAILNLNADEVAQLNVEQINGYLSVPSDAFEDDNGFDDYENENWIVCASWFAMRLS